MLRTYRKGCSFSISVLSKLPPLLMMLLTAAVVLMLLMLVSRVHAPRMARRFRRAAKEIITAASSRPTLTAQTAAYPPHFSPLTLTLSSTYTASNERRESVTGGCTSYGAETT